MLGGRKARKLGCGKALDDLIRSIFFGPKLKALRLDFVEIYLSGQEGSQDFLRSILVRTEKKGPWLEY